MITETGQAVLEPGDNGKKQQACLSCRRSKHRCVPSSDPDENRCLRCIKRGETCLLKNRFADDEWQAWANSSINALVNETTELRARLDQVYGIVEALCGKVDAAMATNGGIPGLGVLPNSNRSFPSHLSQQDQPTPHHMTMPPGPPLSLPVPTTPAEMPAFSPASSSLRQRSRSHRTSSYDSESMPIRRANKAMDVDALVLSDYDLQPTAQVFVAPSVPTPRHLSDMAPSPSATMIGFETLESTALTIPAKRDISNLDSLSSLSPGSGGHPPPLTPQFEYQPSPLGSGVSSSMPSALHGSLLPPPDHPPPAPSSSGYTDASPRASFRSSAESNLRGTAFSRPSASAMSDHAKSGPSPSGRAEPSSPDDEAEDVINELNRVAPDPPQPEISGEGLPILGSRDTRKNLIFRGHIGNREAHRLYEFFHEKIAPDLLGFPLKPESWPYERNTVDNITPHVLTTILLLSAERMPSCWNRVDMLRKQAASEDLEEVAAVDVRQRAELAAKRQARLEGDQLEKLHKEIGIGPEEIVAAALLGLYSTGEHAVLQAKTAFAWARSLYLLLKVQERSFDDKDIRNVYIGWLPSFRNAETPADVTRMLTWTFVVAAYVCDANGFRPPLVAPTDRIEELRRLRAGVDQQQRSEHILLGTMAELALIIQQLWHAKQDWLRRPPSVDDLRHFIQDLDHFQSEVVLAKLDHKQWHTVHTQIVRLRLSIETIALDLGLDTGIDNLSLWREIASDWIYWSEKCRPELIQPIVIQTIHAAVRYLDRVNAFARLPKEDFSKGTSRLYQLVCSIRHRLSPSHPILEIVSAIEKTLVVWTFGDD